MKPQLLNFCFLNSLIRLALEKMILMSQDINMKFMKSLQILGLSSRGMYSMLYLNDQRSFKAPY